MCAVCFFFFFFFCWKHHQNLSYEIYITVRRLHFDNPFLAESKQRSEKPVPVRVHRDFFLDYLTNDHGRAAADTTIAETPRKACKNKLCAQASVNVCPMSAWAPSIVPNFVVDPCMI